MKPASGLALLAVLALMAPGNTHAQFVSARRMAMGGAVIARGGPGSDAVNVACRAVPRAPHSTGGFSLPIGVVPVLSDPPEFDPKKPGFNGFELVNLLYDPPWNLMLSQPPTPSSDVTVSVARNSLAIDMGDVRRIFPDEDSRMGMVSHAPALVVGIGRAFVGLSPLVHVDNDLGLDPNLRGALAGGKPFLPRTDYALHDHAIAQVAIQAMAGWAQAVWRPAGADARERSGLYAGARAKLLRGLAYAEARNSAAFTTSDTLFANGAVDARYSADLLSAETQDGKFGHGADLGVVFVRGATELGFAVNDIGTRIGWNVKESVTVKDTATGNYSQQTVSESKAFTSTVPATYLLTASTRVGEALVVGDLVRSSNETTTAHAGVERWLGRWAIRAGTAWDANGMLQGSGGVGLRFGKLGFDVAVASNSRNISRERAVELGAGLAFYH